MTDERPPHERYRDRLALLAEPTAAVTELLGAGKRHYGRFHPGEPVWAVVVTELAGGGFRTVELSRDRLPGSALHPHLGPFRVSEPGDDRALPGLRPTLERGTGSRILRYRPGARCTLRTSRHGTEWIVKVLADGPGTADTVARLDRQQLGLAEAAETGAMTFRVAGSGPTDPAHGALWQSVVPGRPIEGELLGPDGAALAHRIGDALATAHRRLCPRPTVPVHGAPHMHQWLLDGDRLRLYRLHKRLAKATRTAWALRPDGDRRAAQHLARVADSLG